MHYNEAQNIKFARQLIEKELRREGGNNTGDEEEEEDDDEMRNAASSDCRNPELGEHLVVLWAHVAGVGGGLAGFFPMGR